MLILLRQGCAVDEVIAVIIKSGGPENNGTQAEAVKWHDDKVWHAKLGAGTTSSGPAATAPSWCRYSVNTYWVQPILSSSCQTVAASGCISQQCCQQHWPSMRNADVQDNLYTSTKGDCRLPQQSLLIANHWAI